MSTKTARAAIFHGAGQPFELIEAPVPTPGDGEILVRVSCCTLCTSDLHTHAGRRAEPTPTVLGHEAVGRIEAFGSGAPTADWRSAKLAFGDRVSWSVAASCGGCFFCKDGLPQKCESLFKYGHERITPPRVFSGGLAEYVLLKPGSAVFRLPESLSDVLAAPANCATATAAAVLRAAGPIAGREVLILGAGTLGLTAAAMARTAGASHVLVSDPDAARREYARRFKVGHVVSADEAGMPELVARAKNGRGVDVVLELAGVAQAVQTGMNMVRTGGTLILAGTVLPTPSVPLEPEKVVRRLLTIRGVHNYAPRDLAAALDFLDGSGRAFPFETLVGATFPLAEVDAAFAHAHKNPGQRVAVVP